MVWCSSGVNGVGPVTFVRGLLFVITGLYMYCFYCFCSIGAEPLVCAGPLLIGAGPVCMVWGWFWDLHHMLTVLFQFIPSSMMPFLLFQFAF